MIARRTTLLFALALALFASACDDDDSNGKGPSTPTTTATNTPADPTSTATVAPTNTQAPATASRTSTTGATPTSTFTATPTASTTATETATARSAIAPQFVGLPDDALTLAGALTVTVDVGGNSEDAVVGVSVDGAPAGTLNRDGNTAHGSAGNLTAGTHEIEVSVEIDGDRATSSVTVEAVAIANPDECEILNTVACLLPYPSSRFLEPADTATGYRINFPLSGMPKQRSTPFPVEPFRRLDGFSPTAPIAMYFQGGVDEELSNASRLLAATRTHDLSSLDPNSPSVLIDATTGERVLHFLQHDARAQRDGTPDRELLFLNPAQSLIPGHRYVVAMRNLVRHNGNPVVAEATFAALRDNRPSTINALEQRRPLMEALFSELATYGIARESLVLAWDFVVASDQSLTQEMLTMRDETFAWFATATQPTFTVESTTESDCANPDTRIWRRVEGTFQSPLYLKADPIAQPTNTATLNLDGSGKPVANGFTNPPFTIGIPCSVLDDEGPPVYPVVLGHGLFGDGRGFVRELGETREIETFNYIAGATDWTGLSATDANLDNIVSSFVGRVALDQPRNFPALPDRMRQGQLNTLLLARMMKTGAFNVHPSFQRPDGSGVLPGPEVDEFYFGASLGGIMGLMFAALSPDVENVHVDVPGISFAFLLPRSIAFLLFEGAIELTGVRDKIDQALFLVLTHELWVRGESAGYATHITENPLPGTNAKHVLMTAAIYDQLVSNQATDLAARTLKLPSLVGSVLPNRPLLPDLEGPLDSGLVYYDTGVFDPNNPAHVPFIPPLANVQPAMNDCDPHRRQAFTPAAIDQLFEFLSPGGQVVNFCDGLCDAAGPYELPYNGQRPCDPLD